tara:strand:+ start:885 stop:1256 length:372 start_codon:yes stop_codon:yes gene_type:complete
MRVGDLKRGVLLQCIAGWGAYKSIGKVIKMLPNSIVPDQDSNLKQPGADGIMMFLGMRKTPPAEIWIRINQKSKSKDRWYEVLHASGVWYIKGKDFRYIEPIDTISNREALGYSSREEELSGE